MSLTTSVPFNTRIITDPSYIVSATFPNVTPSLDFIQKTPYPTTTERAILSVVATVTAATSSGVSASITLQHSDDNNTWVNIPQKANPFISMFETGTTVITGSILTSFEPDGKRYVRSSASFTGTAGGGVGTVSGSHTLTVQF